MNEIRTYFEGKFKEYRIRNPEDSALLLGSLMEWGAAVLPKVGGNLGEAIEDQVRYRANKRGISPERFIDSLFSNPDHDKWMLEFQV